MSFVGCHEEVYPRNIHPYRYVIDNDDSYSRLFNGVDQVVRFVFPKISMFGTLADVG
jgi:hypothetical protein